MKPRSVCPSPVIPLSRPRLQHVVKRAPGNSRSKMATTSVALSEPTSSTETPQPPLPSPQPMIQTPHPNPPTQTSSTSPSTPSVLSCVVTEAHYEAVTQEILSRVPLTIRSKFERSRDPRLLFPFALDGSKKKVLSDWLDAHYFIPKDLVTPVPASTYAAGPDSRASGFDLSGNDHRTPAVLPAAPNEVADAHASTFGAEVDFVDLQRPSLSAMRDVTNMLTSLCISDKHDVSTQPHKKSSVHTEQPIAISPLLEVSGQAAPHDFGAFVSTFHAKGIHAHHDSGGRKLLSRMKDLTWRKIGEASFSEVFRVGEVVLKIVPLEYHDFNSPHINPADSAVGARERTRPKPRPNTSLPEDVLREINATGIMGGVHSGFTNLLWYPPPIYSFNETALTELVNIAPMSSRDAIPAD